MNKDAQEPLNPYEARDAVKGVAECITNFLKRFDLPVDNLPIIAIREDAVITLAIPSMIDCMRELVVSPREARELGNCYRNKSPYEPEVVLGVEGVFNDLGAQFADCLEKKVCLRGFPEFMATAYYVQGGRSEMLKGHDLPETESGSNYQRVA